MRAKGRLRNTRPDVSTGGWTGGIFLLAKSILQLLPFFKLKKERKNSGIHNLHLTLFLNLISLQITIFSVTT